MTLGQKLQHLRQLEGDLRGLGRPLTQSELVRAVKSELGKSISQSYLSLIEKGERKHLTDNTRRLLAHFFKVHPGYLVSDPPGFRTELSPEVAAIETSLDRWLNDGAARFAGDPALASALERVGAHADSRRCLLLIGEMLSMPGLVERLAQTLLPEEARS
jgi:transcriptional regulator with XRE-family HTH domain